MVKKLSPDKRVYLDKAKAVDLKTKMKQLLDASNQNLEKPLPDFMAELLLNEIKLSTDEANEHLRNRARLLGLM